jgi:hypothetical protein
MESEQQFSLLLNTKTAAHFPVKTVSKPLNDKATSKAAARQESAQDILYVLY